MKILNENTKFAHLGKPGSVFSRGFQRRLDMITEHIDLKDKKILDLGTGDGVWLEKFAEFTGYDNVYASEFDKETLDNAKTQNPKLKSQNLKNCPGEALDFEDNFFDVVFMNEVLEHVQDDKKTLEESLRVLKPGGMLIFFTPNRGWPFEQHGAFFRGKYYWGNIFLLPWMPKFISKRFAPHVKNYWGKDIRKLLRHSGPFDSAQGDKFIFRTLLHTRIFPGFDKLERRFGVMGRVVQKCLHALEKTPLNWFGISHFVIAEKVAA